MRSIFADTDEMTHIAAFHLGLYCLQKYLFMWFLSLYTAAKNIGRSIFADTDEMTQYAAAFHLGLYQLIVCKSNRLCALAGLRLQDESLQVTIS